ncbi:MAG: hypothetical protein QXO70_03120 [Candidatus Pacearchaeota archaeon]
MITETFHGSMIVSGTTEKLPILQESQEVPHILYYTGGKLKVNEFTKGVVMKVISYLNHMAIYCLENNLPFQRKKI